jgi:hypothetical protein
MHQAISAVKRQSQPRSRRLCCGVDCLFSAGNNGAHQGYGGPRINCAMAPPIEDREAAGPTSVGAEPAAN